MTRNLNDQGPTVGHRRALLIGVRTYPFISGEYGHPLAGCHNDVAHMREALLGRGFNESSIEVLVDRMEGCECPFCGEEQEGERALPTRKEIFSAVQRLWEATEANDIAVIYFSGHGSEFSGRGLHVGQRFQTIVPHDSGRRDAENRDIADREIEGWVRDFSAKTPYLTLIFDCCHSGGIADLRGDVMVGRQVRADERSEPAALDSELRKLSQEEPSNEDRGSSGWFRGAGRSAVILSASAAKELSSETMVEGKKQGLFTHHLTKALREQRQSKRWADLFPQVAQGVNNENLSQHPRREGNAPIFSQGEVEPDDVYPPDVIELKKLAVVIGIDYQAPQDSPEEEGRVVFPPLRAPKNDAEEVARVLEEVQGYEIVGLSRKNPGPLLNEKATRKRIHQVINRLVKVRVRSQRETAVVIYFAGHGVVQTQEDGEHAGYLVPWDADRDDPTTWLPMKDLRDQLVDGIRDAERLTQLQQSKPLQRLTSRHLLLILDCCFGGALAFDFFRGSDTPDRPIYYSEYKRFVEGAAWQLLNSASYNQQALDRDPKDPEDPHSPFARGLIEALTTDRADARREGARSDKIITATELHQFIDARLKQMGVDIQTPGLMPLRPIQGQFIFHVPGCDPTPLPDPVLRPESNPWCGGEAYGTQLIEGGGVEEEPFFGREEATFHLLTAFLSLSKPSSKEQSWPSLVVHGSSGCGATSLVRAGLLPLLAEPAAGRKKMRSFLHRREGKHFLISREDLKAVRKWAGDLSLANWLGEPETLADEVRKWALEEGVLSDGEEGETLLQARLEMEHYGVPSFAESRTSGETPGWVRRLALVELLETPETLAERLKLWLEKGGIADFLSVRERSLGRLVGRWKVVTTLPAQVKEEAEEKVAEDLLLLVDVEGQDTEDRRLEVWRELAKGPRQRTVATLRSDAVERDAVLRQMLAGKDEEGRDLWQVYAVPKTSRDELQEVITGPASSKVLFFEPPELVDRILAEVEHLPTPLPLLSAALAEMYNRAWKRRRDEDRQLLEVDLGPLGALGFLSERAEATWCRLIHKDPALEPILQNLFRRLLSSGEEQTAGRQVSWRQLELVQPAVRQRLETLVLPAFVGERVLVAHREFIELSSPGLVNDWARLHHLSMADTACADYDRPSSIDPQTIWHRALEWERSGFDRGKLWARDTIVRTLTRSTTLNQLEWAFVVASEMDRRLATLRALANLASHSLQSAWEHCAALVGAVAQLSLETRGMIDQLLAEPQVAYGEPWVEAREMLWQTRDHSAYLAEQTLRDVLLETPLSVPLPLPTQDKVTGLRIVGRHQLQVRIGEQAWAWNLADLQEKPRRLPSSAGPRAGEAQAAVRWHPLIHDVEFPPVSVGFLAPIKAQAGHNRIIRFFAPRRHRFIRPPKIEPVTLHGHRGVPVFLAFSKLSFFEALHEPLRNRCWLVSAANSAVGGELRCWPVKEPRGLPSEPLSFVGKKLEDALVAEALEEQEFKGPDLQQISAGDPLPATVSVGGSQWQVESLAGDGSSFTLRNLKAAESHVLSLFVANSATRGEKEERHFRPLPRPRGRSLPALSELGGPSLPPKALPPWLSSGAQGIRQLLFSDDGRWLAASSEDGAAGLWALPSLRLVWSTGGAESSRTAKGQSVHVTVLAFNPVADAEVVLVAGTEEGNPWFVTLGGEPGGPEDGPVGRISTMAWSPDGERLAVGSLDGTVRLWRARPGISTHDVGPVVLRCSREESLAVRRLAFDREGKKLMVERRAVYEPYDHRVEIYSMELEQLMRLARGHGGRDLEPRDVPSELWLHLFETAEEKKREEVRKEDRDKDDREKALYLADLGLPPGGPDPGEQI